MMYYIRKVCATLLLLSFVSFCAFGESLQVPLPTIIKPDIEGLNQNLETLEQNWSLLIIENQRLQDSLAESKTSQAKLWSMYQENTIYSFQLEQRLEKSERKLKIWKGTVTVLSCLSIALGTTLLITLRK